MNEKSKIVYVLDSLGVGGVERNTINIANHLSKAHKVVIISLTSNQLDMLPFVSDRVEFRAFKSSRVFISFPKLAWYFLKNRGKLAIIISAKEYVNVTCLLAAVLSGVANRVITTTRTHLSTESNHSQLRLFSVYLHLARYLYPRARANVCVSKGVASDLESIIGLKRKPIVIYNPAAKSNVFSASFEKPHEWFSGSIPVIIGCGRLVEQKDFSLLIKAFAALREKREVKLIILGEGPYRSSLELLTQKLGLEKDVLLLGNVKSPEAFMQHASLFVLSSKWEGFANVIVEALSVGCPVVAMDCSSGPSEILEDGKWGVLVKERSAAALSSGMLKALQNLPVDRKVLQQRALDFVPEKIAEDYLKLMEH